MEIKKGENKFYIGEDENKPIAEITFVDGGEGEIVVNRTFVSKEMEGQGIAKKLLNKVVEYAREEDLKIMAICSYAVAKLDSDEYSDVYVK